MNGFQDTHLVFPTVHTASLNPIESKPLLLCEKLQSLLIIPTYTHPVLFQKVETKNHRTGLFSEYEKPVVISFITNGESQPHTAQCFIGSFIGTAKGMYFIILCQYGIFLNSFQDSWLYQRFVCPSVKEHSNNLHA